MTTKYTSKMSYVFILKYRWAAVCTFTQLHIEQKCLSEKFDILKIIDILQGSNTPKSQFRLLDYFFFFLFNMKCILLGKDKFVKCVKTELNHIH